MKDLKKVLCPLDFSAISEKTVKYALSFSQQFGISPQFLHVSTKPPDVYYRFFPDVTGYLRTVEENVQDQANKFVKRLEID